MKAAKSRRVRSRGSSIAIPPFCVAQSSNRPLEKLFAYLRAVTSVSTGIKAHSYRCSIETGSILGSTGEDTTSESGASFTGRTECLFLG